MLTSLNDAIARGEPFVADAEMVSLLQSATVLAERSDNLFNPAIGRLVRLWGFHSGEFAPRDPPPQEIRRWSTPIRACPTCATTAPPSPAPTRPS